MTKAEAKTIVNALIEAAILVADGKVPPRDMDWVFISLWESSDKVAERFRDTPVSKQVANVISGFVSRNERGLL